MYRILSFLTKRSDLSAEQFRDYYENRHVPLVLSLAPSPPVYKRRYLDRNNMFSDNGAVVDFDVATEVVFPNEEAFRAWYGTLMSPENGDRVPADEAMFLDRSRTRAYVVDECATAG